MKIISILLLFLSFSAYAVDCKKHPIYCQIKKNQPEIDSKFAMRLSNVIYEMHKKYHIPTRIFTAILMQESGYTLKVNGCHSGLYQKSTPEEARDQCHTFDVQKFSDCFKEKTEFVEKRICSDFGISQIYYKTAQRFKIDITRLTTDLEYSVEAGARVLADFMERHEAKDNDWWVRYNCGARGTTKRDTCQIYKKLVERYL